MPLASAEHGHARIEAFLWGLLPDNDRVLENWGRRFQVSPRNVFRLIAHVGEDCAALFSLSARNALKRCNRTRCQRSQVAYRGRSCREAACVRSEERRVG